MESQSQIDRIRAQQVATLYRDAVPGTVGAFAAGLLLVGLLGFMGGFRIAIHAAFIAMLVLHTVFRLSLCWIYRRATPSTRKIWRTWLRWMVISALIGGLVWGGGGILLMSSRSLDQQLLVVSVVAAIAAGAVSAFGSYLPAFMANFLPMMLSPTLWIASHGDIPHLGLAILILLWLATILVVARNFYRSVTDAYRLRFENLDLVDDLRRQKEVAEEANMAKSRFLASASHDLRQPVHALGMFIAALRGRAMDNEAHRLVAHIEGSVSALDDLFTSLLDISHLDAGTLHPETAAFPVQPILERACRDYSEEAGRKGVRLVLQPCSLVVRSEPVLLERIVRNLVANAVRYTKHGRVLVGCRRSGDRLSIQVWDTGVGIPPDQQPKVFEEFYQLHNPERDRSKGLGLGLAIVKRLSLLLDHPLALRSEPGRGSVFKVEIPVAEEGMMVPSQAEPGFAARGHGLILVIDDEIAIQEAMRSLLVSWGYDVITAGSGAEMLHQLATCPERPNLIVCDYRLRGDENGVAVIQQLQSEYNDEIPGVLITGDTAPDRLREAQESGFLLLHKPVPNGKLRAAIGNLIATRSAAEADA